MALVKWEPKRRELEPLRGLRDEVDRLFDEFFRGWPRPFASAWPGARWPQPEEAQGGFFPVVNLKETNDEFVLTAELPGVEKNELTISLTEDSVVLKGERKEEKETKEENYHYREASYGSFERAVSLPGSIKPSEATATLKDGVLTLTLPKAEETKKKEIRIEVK
jgi:HSP20 family protein